MQYIKIKDGIYVEFDENTNKSRTVVVSELERTLQQAEERLKELQLPSDEELLTWARENFATDDMEVRRLSKLKDEIKITLLKINGD